MNVLLSRYARVGVALVLAVLLIAAFSGSAAASGPVNHVVVRGESLTTISIHYNISIWAIACANGLWEPDHIHDGMVLWIPDKWFGECRPEVRKPVFHEPVKWIPPRQIKCDCFYRVRWGDNLFRISLRFHTSVWALMEANDLDNPNLVFAGMLLRVPCNRWDP